MVGLASVVLLVAVQATSPPVPSAASLCDAARLAVATSPTRAAAEICAGQQELAAADRASDEVRLAGYRAAASHWRLAANLLSDADLKFRLLMALSELYDGKHLAEPGLEEVTLRESMATRPEALAPVFRLAALLEASGFVDGAEDVLLNARRQHVSSVEVYQQLAQFYVRQVLALQDRDRKAPPKPLPSSEPDERGIYPVGGALAQPPREGTPRYPKAAQDAGIEGVVIAQIVVGPDGRVAEADLVRSIPLLDEAALDAIRAWRYEPTVINGQAVPVRMTVTVNFSLRR